MAVAQMKDTSTTFHNVLVATDFSPCSERALSEAAAVAARENAHLFVMHALGPDLDVPVATDVDPEAIAAEQQMKVFLGQEREHRVEAYSISRGVPEKVLADLIREKQVDLLVIGTRGRGGMAKFALGSVAERLLRVATCPVLTLGPHAAAPKGSAEFHTIVFATDFGKGSAKALPIALSLAKEHAAKLVMLHMRAPMPATSTSLSAYAPANAGADEITEWEITSHKLALQRLKESVPANAQLQHEPEFIVGTEFLPEGILTVASERKADLIVMGANHTLSLWTAAHLPWSLLHEVICHATCPVLTVAA